MRLALALGSISAASLLATFLTHSLILVAVGPGRETDALFAAMAVPQLVMAVVSGSLTSVLVPLLSSKPEQQARADTWTLVLLATSLSVVVSVPLIVFADSWGPFLFRDFHGQHLALLVSMCRIQALGMIFTAVWGVLSAFHQSRRHFVRVEASQFIAALVVICVIVLTLPRYGIVAAAWLTAARSAFMVFLLAFGIGRFTGLDGRETVRLAWIRLRPLLAGSAVYKTDILVDRVLSAAGPAGGLSLFFFGQQLFAAAAQISSAALANPMVPRLAVLAHGQNWVEFRRILRSRLAAVIAIMAVGLALFAVIGRQTLQLLDGRGGVTTDNVGLLYAVMVSLGGFLVGAACGQITAISFYAQGDTVTPTRIGILTFLGFVPVKISAFVMFGLIGLAISVSVYFMSSFVIQYVLLEIRLRNHMRTNDARELQKSECRQGTNET